MEQLLNLLDSYNNVVFDVSVFSADDLVSLQGVKFNVYDYYKEETAIRLVNESGAELVLPNKCQHLIDDDEEDYWLFRHNNIEVILMIESVE